MEIVLGVGIAAVAALGLLVFMPTRSWRNGGDGIEADRTVGSRSSAESEEQERVEKEIHPLKGPAVSIDLASCDIHGVSVPDWPRYYRDLFGEPEYQDDDRWMYPSRGISCDHHPGLGKIWLVYFWLSETGAKEPFPGHVGEFQPCDVNVVTRERGRLTLATTTTRAEIKDYLGEPHHEEEDDTEAALEYKMQAPDGKSLYVMFEFAMPEKLLGIIVG